MTTPSRQPRLNADAIPVTMTAKFIVRGRERAASASESVEQVAPPGRVPRVARLMALAIRFDGLIRTGAVSTQAELAEVGHVTRARVTQIMNLLHLAPDIQEAVLHLPLVANGREPNRQQHEAKASTEGILSGQTTREEHRVSETTYHVHYKRSDPSAPLTMRVEYRVGFNRFFREWVCFDHTGYARTKAEAWWRARSVEPVPGGTEEAVETAKAGALAPTLSITVEKKAGDQFLRVTQHVLGDKPPRLDSDEGLPDRPPEPAGMTYGIPEDEIPF